MGSFTRVVNDLLCVASGAMCGMGVVKSVTEPVCRGRSLFRKFLMSVCVVDVVCGTWLFRNRCFCVSLWSIFCGSFARTRMSLRFGGLLLAVITLCSKRCLVVMLFPKRDQFPLTMGGRG